MKRYIEKEYFFHWFNSIGFLVLKKVQSSAITNKIHEFVDHDALGLHWGDIKGYLENISSNPSEWSYSDKEFQKYIEGFTVNRGNCVSIGWRRSWINSLKKKEFNLDSTTKSFCSQACLGSCKAWNHFIYWTIFDTIGWKVILLSFAFFLVKFYGRSCHIPKNIFRKT